MSGYRFSVGSSGYDDEDRLVNWQHSDTSLIVARHSVSGLAAADHNQGGQQTIADYPSGTVTGSPTYTYVYASYIDEPVMRGDSCGLRYYHRNQQYSITAVTDGGGSIVERYAYSAYGQVTIFDGSGSVISGSAIANRYTYTGREWDEDLSLYHYRARMYDAVGGRFVSRDPIGYVDGTNLFRLYTGLTSLDPYGEGVIREACRFVKKRGLCLGMVACLGAPGVTCLVACGGDPKWDDIDDDFADCMRKCLRHGIPEEFKLGCAGMIIACLGQKVYEFITTPGNIARPVGKWPQLEIRPDRSLVR